MKYPEPFIDYLVYFHGLRDYFECHEVLEEYWKDIGAPKSSYWVGLIQIAVSLYHHRRGNFVGAKRLMKNALQNLKQHSDSLSTLGFNTLQLQQLLETRLDEIRRNTPYSSIILPVKDPVLLDICKRKCEELGCSYGTASDMSNKKLINKHFLRDRSDVIKERERQIQLRTKVNKKEK